MKIKVSAPGKLMLLGEHAVVYGYPCIVTAVDKRLYVEAEIINQKADEIITPQVKESRFVLESIADFKEKFKVKKSVKVITNGDFSHNVGLGSSSAVTVATFVALSSLFNTTISKREIFDLSYKVNLKIQGVGSGFDIAAATYGGILYFVSGGKVIKPLNIDSLSLVVGYSGIKADTPFIVQNLKLKMQNDNLKIKFNQIFKKIDSFVEKAKISLLQKQSSELGKLMTENHKLLQNLGVSTDKLDAMVDAVLKAGAYGAKLSGAGGGDCMIALVSQAKKQAVEKAIEKVGGEIINVKNNTEGVRREK